MKNESKPVILIIVGLRRMLPAVLFERVFMNDYK
jgi:hypothetical protein